MSERKPGEVASLLMQGHKYLSDPDNWCQMRSRDVQGWLWWRHEKFCATGFIHYSTTDADMRKSALDLLDAEARRIYGCNAMHANDHHGHEACLAIYRAAAQRAMSAGI